LLSSSLLDGSLDGPLCFGVTGVGSRCDLSDTSRRWLVTCCETVMSSVSRSGVSGASDAQEREKGGEDGKTVGEHFECGDGG
jgi:hypothetical protein